MNVTPAVPSASSTVSCPLFDGSLGTLTQPVFLGESFIDSGSITLRNNSDTIAYTNPIVMTESVQFGPVPGDFATKVGTAPVTVGLALLPSSTTTFLVKRSIGSERVFSETARLASFLASPGASTFDVPDSVTTALVQEGLSGAISVLDYSLNVLPGSPTLFHRKSFTIMIPRPPHPACPSQRPARWSGADWPGPGSTGVRARDVQLRKVFRFTC